MNDSEPKVNSTCNYKNKTSKQSSSWILRQNQPWQ